MSGKKLSRHEARELTFKLVFAWDFNPELSAETVYSNYLEEDTATDETVKNSFYSVVENISEIDQAIEEVAENWKVSRLSTVTRALLRLAVYELKFTDTPGKVVMNEAIELAKAYDDDGAPAFINGILNKIARSLERIGNNE